MENASKALLIAGGVLIAVIVLSMGVYLYVLFTGQSNTYRNTFDNIEIEKFNSKFFVYAGRDDLTAYDVITAWNKAQEYNETSFAVTVKVNGSVLNSSQTSEGFLRDYSDQSFSCSFDSVGYDSSGRINELNFSEL